MTAGLDLRPDRTTLNPTRMLRNDIKVVAFTFPPEYPPDLTEMLCQVRRVPDGTVVKTWAVALDGGNPLRLLVTYDATDLDGEYEYDLEDAPDHTLWGPYKLIVDRDITLPPEP
mgnify:CR=1 FL=1